MLLEHELQFLLCLRVAAVEIIVLRLVIHAHRPLSFYSEEWECEDQSEFERESEKDELPTQVFCPARGRKDGLDSMPVGLHAANIA